LCRSNPLQLDHPSIVRIAAAYESDHEIFIVQELCRGGDLFDRLESRLNEADELNETGLHFTESQCAQYVKQMLAATSYLHSKGIVHRDLKLEHFMFSTPGSQELRMIDFGYASHLDDSGRVSGMAGTTYTKAPEVLQGGEYNEKFDLWSIGVLAYLLLAGDTPFGSLDENSSTRSNSCKRAIRHEKLKFEPQEKWDQISNEAKVFIQRLLERDPEERPSAAQALEDPWITACTNSGGCTGKNLSSSTLKSLLAFRRASEVQKLLSEVLSYTLFPAQIMGLRREFAKIDQHDTGVIDLDSMKEVLLRSSRNSGWLLSEKNVEEIFDSIKTTKTEKSIPIRWHEFLAAGITQTQYDERNMRLCFEKLDTRNRNYITFDDLARIVGRDANSEGLAESWRQSIEDLKIEGERITYIDFAKLMKGRDEPLKLAPGNTEPPIGSNIPKGPGLEDPGTTSPPLQAHTGDVFDKFLNEVTSSSLIANRSLHTQSRDLFLPTVVESMLTANIASIKLVRKHRGKANSSPASADCCKARHSRRISDSNF
jgi:calcium-dependent protein kinase